MVYEGQNRMIKINKPHQAKKTIDDTLIKPINEAIERAGSVQRLTYLSGVNQLTISKALRKKIKLKQSTIKRIADAVGMDISDFKSISYSRDKVVNCNANRERNHLMTLPGKSHHIVCHYDYWANVAFSRAGC